ncbi:universal stress protein [Desulfobulbus propionicus]|jgi:nucleotide-binding universal stress UspA family protein
MHSIPTIKTILYTTALGSHTRPVFRYAISLARQYNAKIILLHVVEPLSSTARAVIETYMSVESAEQFEKDNLQQILTDIKDRLKKFCKEVMESSKTDVINVQEILVVAGDPTEEILHAAQQSNADLIVMGKSSGSVFGSTVMGSVARRVSRHAKIPVLIVPNH